MNLIEMIDLPVIDKFNAVGGVLIVLVTYIFGEHWVLFTALLVLNFLDFITGTMKARMLKKESSSAGTKGIIKKFSGWVMIVLAFGMAPIFNEVGLAVGADFSSFSPIIGWYVLATTLLNEFRSILENLVESGVKVPGLLVSGLKVMEKVVQAQEVLFDGSLEINPESDDEYRTKLETPIKDLEERESVTLKIQTIHSEEE